MLMDVYNNIKRNITEDGLIVSSSGFLVSAMIGKIDFSRSLKILEIGSGKGAFTGELISRMSCQSELDVCEIKSEYNPHIHRLIASHPTKVVRLHNCCVTRLLAEAETYDVILSSLPLKNFECANDGNAFLNQVLTGFRHSLKTDGIYLQYQYFKSNQSDIETIFERKMDTVDFVPLNILPAFVYRMTKQRPPGDWRKT